jgi:hypothetical protein
LICLEIDGSHREEQRVNQTEHDSSENRHEQHGRTRKRREASHDESTTEGSHYHGAFKTEVDDAAVFRVAASESDKEKYGCINESIL